MTITVGLAMIVRNEEANLASCLDSVKNAVDEMVIVDTGSSDRTVEIARRYTDKVYHYPWQDDFSAARNFALEHTRSQWILSLDADEELDTASGDLRALVLDSEGYDAFFLPLYNRTAQPSDNFTRFFVLRLFRNCAEYRFHGRIHEQVLIRRPEAVGIAEGPVIWHKLAPESERNRKRGRNLALLQQAVAEEPANPFLQYYLGVEWLGLGQAEKALPCLRRACADLTDGHIFFRAPAVRYVMSCLKILGRLDEAICICLEESQRYPSYTDMFFDGGVLFEEKGEYEIAIRWFNEAVRCGQPPALFSHTNGTESFLSFYHLGYCHEKLGRLEEARNYYEQALASNPDYIYPLYNLFLLNLVEKGPEGAFNHFKASGRLDQPQQAIALADLFFEAGFADLACTCLDNAATGTAHFKDNYARRLAQFQICAGRLNEALSLIDGIRHAREEIDFELTVDETVALILKEDYDTARSRALLLWRQPDKRATAWALLNLIALCASNSICGRPEKTRHPAVIRTLLDVLEKCLRFRPWRPKSNAIPLAGRYHRLVNETIGYLSQLSPEGSAALSAYFQGKAATVRRLMDYKYGQARRLFHA